jgi:hypothetical protein
MRGVARIAPVLESVEGGVESAIEALRLTREADVIPFLQKYDSVPPADRPYLSIDEICVASGTDPWRLLALAVEGMVKLSVVKTQIEVYGSLPRVTRTLVKNALTAKVVRDRRLFFQITGILPTARPAGPFAAFPKTRAQKTEAQPEARPAGSPAVMKQPWRRTPPGKVS